MLGTEVEAQLKKSELAYWATDREVDITDDSALSACMKDKSIDWVINCAAYTAVDQAEDEIEAAYRLNRDGVCNLAALVRQQKARLLHISTDYVFDGKKKPPTAYQETDLPHPLSIYGKSKLAGEQAITRHLNGNLIVRTAWLYGLRGHNFVKTMLQLFGERDQVKVVDDQWGSPTYAGDLARALIQIITASHVPAGIYHFSNMGVTTWYRFALEILQQAKERGLIAKHKKVQITPITTAQFPTQAIRPQNSLLSKQKINCAKIVHPKIAR